VIHGERDTSTRCPTSSRRPISLSVFERYVEALNARDFDLVESFYASDALFYGRAVSFLEGRETIRSFFEDWFGVYEEFAFEPEEFRDLGNGVTFNVISQRGRVADTAAWIPDSSAVVVTWTDGLIKKVTNFTDIDEGRDAAEQLAKERG
jgi:ketosteroid isomerase-like protein